MRNVMSLVALTVGVIACVATAAAQETRRERGRERRAEYI